MPNQPARIKCLMPDVCHTFRTGNRIVMQIQSTWFPLVGRKPQVFEDISTAQARDFVKATERVFYEGGNGLRVKVMVMK